MNVPVTDNFFVRVVGFYEQSDGFIINLSDTGSNADYEHYNFRGAFRWLVNDRFTVDFSATRTVENDGADTNVNSGVFDTDTIGSTPQVLPVVPGASTYVPFATLAPVDSGRGFYADNTRYINNDFKESNEQEITLLNARLNYQGDNWSFRSITGYMDSQQTRYFDQDLTQFGIYQSGPLGSNYYGESFSQEIRLNFVQDNWDITIGGLYAKDSLDFAAEGNVGSDGLNYFATLNPDGTIATCGFCLPPFGIFPSSSARTFDATSYALFADANWQVTDRLLKFF